MSEEVGRERLVHEGMPDGHLLLASCPIDNNGSKSVFKGLDAFPLTQTTASKH